MADLEIILSLLVPKFLIKILLQNAVASTKEKLSQFQLLFLMCFKVLTSPLVVCVSEGMKSVGGGAVLFYGLLVVCLFNWLGNFLFFTQPFFGCLFSQLLKLSIFHQAVCMKCYGH